MMLTTQHRALVRWLSRLSALVYYCVLSVILRTCGHRRYYKVSFVLSIVTTIVICIWLLLDFAVIVIVKYKKTERCHYMLEHISQTPKPVTGTNTNNVTFNSDAIDKTNVTCSDDARNCQTYTYANYSNAIKAKKLDANKQNNVEKMNKSIVNRETCANVSNTNGDNANNTVINNDVDASKHNSTQQEHQKSSTHNTDKVNQKSTAASHSGDRVRPFTFVRSSFGCSTNSLPFTVPSDSKANSQNDGTAENVAYFPARTQVFYNCYQEEQLEQKRRQQLLAESLSLEQNYEEHQEREHEQGTINGIAENTGVESEESSVFDVVDNSHECKETELDNVGTSRLDKTDGTNVNSSKEMINTSPTENMNSSVIVKEESASQHALKQLTNVFDEQSLLHAENSPKMELLDLIAGSSDNLEGVTNNDHYRKEDDVDSFANVEHARTQQAEGVSDNDFVRQTTKAKTNRYGFDSDKVNYRSNENTNNIKLTKNPLIRSSSTLAPTPNNYSNNWNNQKDNNTNKSKYEQVITHTLVIRTIILYILLILSVLLWVSAFYISYDTCNINTALAAFFVQPLWANFVPLQAVYLQARKELYHLHCKTHSNQKNNLINVISNNNNNNINSGGNNNNNNNIKWGIYDDKCHLEENCKLRDLSYLARVESFLNFHDKLLQMVLHGYTTSIVCILSLCVYIAAVIVLSTAQWPAVSLYVNEYTYEQSSSLFALHNNQEVNMINYTLHLNTHDGLETVLSYHTRSKELYIISSLSPVCLFFAMSLAVLTLVTSSYEVLYSNAQRMPESIMSRVITTAESAYEEPWQTPRQSEIAIRNNVPFSLPRRPCQSSYSQNTKLTNVLAPHETCENTHDTHEDRSEQKADALMNNEQQMKEKQEYNNNNNMQFITPERTHHATEINDYKLNKLIVSDPDHHFTLNNVNLLTDDNVTLSEDALSSMTLDDRYSSVSSVVRQSFSVHALESFPEVAEEYKRHSTILPVRGSILSNSKEFVTNAHNPVTLSAGNAPNMDRCNCLLSNELCISPLHKNNLTKRSSEQESMLRDYSVMTSLEVKHSDLSEMKTLNQRTASVTPSMSPQTTLPMSLIKQFLPPPQPPSSSLSSSPQTLSLVQTRNLTMLYLAYRPVNVINTNNTLLNGAINLSSIIAPPAGSNVSSVHNTHAVTSHNNQNDNKCNNINTIPMRTSEHNAFVGFEALLRALYVIEKRLSDENENDTSNKNARKRSNKPTRRLFSLRSETKVSSERITYTLTAYEDALCLIWGIQPFASDPILLALQMATEFVNYFASVNLSNNINNNSLLSYRLVAAIVHSPQTVLACLEQSSSLNNVGTSSSLSSSAAIYNNNISVNTVMSSNRNSGEGVGIINSSNNSSNNSNGINLSVDNSFLSSNIMHGARNKNSKIVCLTKSIHFFNCNQHAIGAQLLEHGFTIYAQRLSEEFVRSSWEQRNREHHLSLSSEECNFATWNHNMTNIVNRSDPTSVQGSSSFHGILLDSRAAHNAAQLVLCRPCGLVCGPDASKFQFSWEGGMADNLHTLNRALGVSSIQENSNIINIPSSGTVNNKLTCAVCYDFINYIPYKEDEEWHLMLARKAELGKKFMSLTEAEQQIQQNNLDAAIAIMQTSLLPYTISPGAVDCSANVLDAETVMMTKLLLHQVQAFRDARQKLDEME